MDFDEDDISCLISSKDASLNDANIGGVLASVVDLYILNIGSNLSGAENGFILINGRFKRRVLIFSQKKELN